MTDRHHRRTRGILAAFAATAFLGTATAAAAPASGAPAYPNPPGPGTTAAPPPPALPAAPLCSAAHRITTKLDGGASWEMCWRYSTDAGLILDGITYRPPGGAAVRVLSTARLAQIHVPYDDGGAEYDDLTGAGFGWGLQDLKPAECPGGTLSTVKVPEVGTVKGLCTTTRARGHAYRMASDSGAGVYQAQAKDLLVYTVNKVGWYEYITEWRFSSDGTIGANVGATGSLSPVDYNATDGRGWPIGKGARGYATSHAHNVFWKLDFGLDGGKDRIEQYDSTVTPPTGDGGPTVKTRRTAVTRELAGDAKNMRWWRVVSGTGKNADGHARSYEIVPGHTDTHAGRGFTKHDVYFTQARACEQYASNNIGACAPNAGDSVDKWVNGETLTKPTVWVNIGFHHIARDEDQQPMPVHWQGFQLAPRDVTAMNPLTPSDLASQNGQPPTES
ncbi:copper amine oxidase [Streptomyces sp. NPDC085466]|uniref:copper amine oxidase n=1 Tax=Streptomyces sp. NPDC085466 TaxID=3365725 RepID=UPI0037CEF034